MSYLREIKAWMFDGFGNPLSSYLNTTTGKYVLNIHNADVHDRVINKLVHQETAIVTTLTAATLADGSQYEVEVLDATGFSVGDYLHINTTSVETTHPILLATSAATGPATFTLDRRLDVAHEIGDEVNVAIVDMSTQIGTLATPQEYYVGPEAGEVWHITRLLFSMTHSSAGDLGLFGNQSPLINGVVLRAFVGGQYGTFTNWKDNSDIKLDMYDVDFNTRSSGGGTYGTTGRGTFAEAGAIIRLDGDLGDKIEVYIQDDLTGLLSYTMKFQGHFENQ